MTPVRVLHIFGAMDRGGAELRTVELLRAVDPARVTLEFCTLLGSAGALDGEIRSLGGAVHACPLGASFLPRFIALVRQRRIDVVHSHVHYTSGLILASARVAGVRSRIAHFRSTRDERGGSVARRAYRSLMRRLVDRNATQVIGVANGVLDSAWPGWRHDRRCIVIYNGVDPRPFVDPSARRALRATLRLPDATPIVVHVARFDPLKNQRQAVEVLATVPEAHLVYVGRESPLAAECRHRAVALGVEARVHFVGERQDVPRFLCGADVSLLTSTAEGLPGVVLESLAAGTPVVASDLPGVREIAAVLPGAVRIHRLDEPAGRWAASVRDLLMSPRDASLPARFASSPFALAAAATAFLDVWEQQGRRPG